MKAKDLGWMCCERSKVDTLKEKTICLSPWLTKTTPQQTLIIEIFCQSSLRLIATCLIFSTQTPSKPGHYAWLMRAKPLKFPVAQSSCSLATRSCHRHSQSGRKTTDIYSVGGTHHLQEVEPVKKNDKSGSKEKQNPHHRFWKQFSIVHQVLQVCFKYISLSDQKFAPPHKVPLLATCGSTSVTSWSTKHNPSCHHLEPTQPSKHKETHLGPIVFLPLHEWISDFKIDLLFIKRDDLKLPPSHEYDSDILFPKILIYISGNLKENCEPPSLSQHLQTTKPTTHFIG